VDGYGQFCPVSLAAEIFAQRWTPLIVRELLSGSAGFNDLRRGMPAISTSVLSRRLAELLAAGVIERRETESGAVYALTPAGEELRPVVEQLGVWGKRWLPADYREQDLDPRLLVWDMHRCVRLDQVPRRTIVQLHFSDAPAEHSVFWLLLDVESAEVCTTHPGGDVDVYLRCDVRTLTDIWMGNTTWGAAIHAGKLTLTGTDEMCRALPGWFTLNVFATVGRGEGAALAPAPARA
jgi:DNA-binding HxlR family transcriptional regulator